MMDRRTSILQAHDAWPRWGNFLIGIWLIISAFAWPHTAGAQANTWILGALIAIGSVWALYAPGARFLTTIFAIWLFFATLAIYHASSATRWNNLIAALVVFVLSLIYHREDRREDRVTSGEPPAEVAHEGKRSTAALAGGASLQLIGGSALTTRFAPRRQQRS
jgi:hypothetical protein